jgi:hypothetical protein
MIIVSKCRWNTHKWEKTSSNWYYECKVCNIHGERITEYSGDSYYIFYKAEADLDCDEKIIKDIIE